METTTRERSWLVLALLAAGVLSRLVPHPPNVTPLTAIALFGATYLSRRWGILLPLAIVMISDAFLGGDWLLVFNWTAFALVGLLAGRIRRHPAPGRILSTTLIGSLLFFLVTNFGVWLGSGMYPHTAAGAQHCFIAALPFFRNMVAGDLVYTAALFTGYALLRRAAIARTAGS